MHGSAKGRSKLDLGTFLSTIDSGRKITTIAKKQMIFVQGDPSDSVFYIQIRKGETDRGVGEWEGSNHSHPECGRFLRRRLPRGTVCPPLLRHGDDRLPVMRIQKKAMLDVLHRKNVFSDLFVAYLLKRNIQHEEDLADQLFNSSEKRLARTLLILARFGKEGAPETVIPKIS